MSQRPRLNWIKYLYPGQTGTQTEQNYHRQKRHDHQVDEHSEGVVTGLGVTETGPASLIVDVAAGRAIDSNGQEVEIALAQQVNLTAFVPGAGTQTVYITLAHTVTYNTPYFVAELGVSQNTYILDSYVLQAQVTAPTSTQIELARVELAAAAAQIDDAVASDAPGNNEIDLRYRVNSGVNGLKFVEDQAGDTALAAVTVGEEDCDFNDLTRAFAYVNGLTRSRTRQCTILLFEKSNGQSWTVSSALTIPTYTHLVGVGKPTLNTLVTAGNVITLSTGAGIENIHIEIGAVGWTYQIYANGVDCKIENVVARFELNDTDADFVFGVAAGGHRTGIFNCKVLPYSSDVTKGCSCLEILDGADNVLVDNCYFEGPLNLIVVSDVTPTSSGIHLSNIVAISHTGGAPSLFDGFGGVHVDNFYGECPAGTAFGFRVQGRPGFCAVVNNITVLCVDDAMGVALDEVIASNVRVTAGRLQVGYNQGKVVLSGGSVAYAADDGLEAILVFLSNCIVSNMLVDRGSVNAPAIAPGGTAVACVISGCILLNTGNVDSILNDEAGSVNWVVDGNVVDEATAAGNGWVLGDEKEV